MPSPSPSDTAQSAPPSDDGLLTIADIARRLSLPESTARYYCKRFAAFMPTVGDGRRRRYRVETLTIIEAIIEAMHTARTASAVEAILARRFPRNAAVQSAPGRAGAADGTSATRATASTAPQPVQPVPVPDDAPAVPPVPVGGVEPGHALYALIEHQTRALDTIAAALSTLAARQSAMDLLADLARSAEGEVGAIRKDVDTLRLLLDSSEKIHQQDLDQLRDWLGRVIADRRQRVRDQV
ncbi:MerR family transcriptional regulator [Nitratidesulfovibrio sp.]|uniref:MerR family transcriptional regulator n=1 Tax=Nitratidesulfovibrio sp. TaxID=2802297 RepID=UPI0033401244